LFLRFVTTRIDEDSHRPKRVLVALEHILSKSLEKDKKLRYQSAAEMRSDLQRLKRDTESGHSAVASAIEEPTSPAPAISPSTLPKRGKDYQNH
jgi:serine/threonine protein kinase